MISWQDKCKWKHREKTLLPSDFFDFNHANVDLLGSVGAIRLPRVVGNAAVHVTNTMLQLLQAKCVFGGMDHENPHEHISNFLDICIPFLLKNIFEVSVRLCYSLSP